MTIPPDEYRDFLKIRTEYREELRRDIEKYVEPHIAAAHDTDKGAIELGQSILKTGTLLNGGALVAIPATVTLFGVDAKSIITQLLVAGGLFALGLLLSWLSGFGGFFALANRADRDYATGEVTRQKLHHGYYPSNDETLEAQQKAEVEKQTTQVERCHRAFVAWRAAAIFFSFLSLVTFVAGNVIGGWAVLHAPTKPASSGAVIAAPPCKDGSLSCQPWERDWSHTNLQPGATVTKEGVVIAPTKP